MTAQASELRECEIGITPFDCSRDNKLAGRLVEVSERLAEQPTPAPTISDMAEDADDEEPGLVDLMAVAEEALPRWRAIIEEFTPVLEQISRLSIEATAQVNESDARGGGFAGRLVVAQRLASALDDPAERILTLGNAYASESVRVDPGILAMLRALESDPSQLEDEDVKELLGSIQSFAVAARENAEATKHLSEVYSGVADVSRVLKSPIRKLKQGLRGILDAHTIIEEWDKRINGFWVLA